MASNLVTLVMQVLNFDTVERIATAIGIDRNIARNAISAAVPALLAKFSAIADEPSGAQRLADAVRQQAGTVDNFTEIMGGGGQTTLIDRGSRTLSALFNGLDQNALTSAVSRFSGLSHGTTASLMSLIAPLVLGTIAKQLGSRVDANALASMLGEQKRNIVNALPPGFSSMLGETGIIDYLGETADTTAEESKHAASYVAQAAREARYRPSSLAPASNNWAYWVIPILAVAALAWYLMGERQEQTAQTVPPAQTTTGTAVTGINATRQISDSIGTLRSTLNDIRDAESARAALPVLQSVTVQVDQVSNQTVRMSPDQRKAVSEVVNPAMPQLNQQFDRVLAIPGASEILKPSIDTLRSKLQTIVT